MIFAAAIPYLSSAAAPYVAGGLAALAAWVGLADTKGCEVPQLPTDHFIPEPKLEPARKPSPGHNRYAAQLLASATAIAAFQFQRFSPQVPSSYLPTESPQNATPPGPGPWFSAIGLVIAGAATLLNSVSGKKTESDGNPTHELPDDRAEDTKQLVKQAVHMCENQFADRTVEIHPGPKWESVALNDTFYRLRRHFSIYVKDYLSQRNRTAPCGLPDQSSPEICRGVLLIGHLLTMLRISESNRRDPKTVPQFINQGHELVRLLGSNFGYEYAIKLSRNSLAPDFYPVVRDYLMETFEKLLCPNG